MNGTFIEVQSAHWLFFKWKIQERTLTGGFYNCTAHCYQRMLWFPSFSHPLQLKGNQTHKKYVLLCLHTALLCRDHSTVKVPLNNGVYKGRHHYHYYYCSSKSLETSNCIATPQYHDSHGHFPQKIQNWVLFWYLLPVLDSSTGSPGIGFHGPKVLRGPKVQREDVTPATASILIPDGTGRIWCILIKTWLLDPGNLWTSSSTQALHPIKTT